MNSIDVNNKCIEETVELINSYKAVSDFTVDKENNKKVKKVNYNTL